jgi:hypothetical protein
MPDPSPNTIVVTGFDGDPARVAEVIIPYFQGTVDEAVRVARETVTALTVDDFPGVKQAIEAGDEDTLVKADVKSIINALIFG